MMPTVTHGRRIRLWLLGLVALVAVLASTTRGDGDASSYTFLRTVGDRPVAYPCAPIRYTINTALAPDDFLQVVHGAIGVMSAASGYRFQYVGPSGERDFLRHGAGPVLIGFANSGEVPGLAGDVAGRGGSVPGPDGVHYATGVIMLDAEFYRRRNSLEVRRAVVLHELGHVLGLGHVADADELMAPKMSHPELAAGDLAGLRRLHEASCGPAGRP